MTAARSNSVRCLLGMLGTDVHSKGIRTIARLLGDAGGIDVSYIGEHNTVEAMADAVVATNADMVGVSFSSAAYVEYTRQLIAAMKERGVDHIPLMLGGLIHPGDLDELKGMGVAGLFGPGSKIEEIIAFVRSAGAERR